VHPSLGPEGAFVQGPLGLLAEGSDALVFLARFEDREVVVKCVSLDESLDSWFVYQVSQEPDRSQPVRGVATCFLVGQPVLPESEVLTRVVVVQERVTTLAELRMFPEDNFVGRTRNRCHAQAMSRAIDRIQNDFGVVDLQRPTPDQILKIGNGLDHLASDYLDDLVHGLIVQGRRLVSRGLCEGVEVVDLHPGNVGISVHRPVRPQAVIFDDVLAPTEGIS